MRKTLNANGYPPHRLRRGIRETEVIVKKMSAKTENNQTPNKKPTFTFLTSYYREESIIFAQRLKRTFKRFLPLLQIRIAFHKNRTLKSIFLPIQKGHDVTKKIKRLVYQVPCSNCDRCYIGETNREKSARIKEHKKYIRNNSESSHIVKHANKEKHSFDFGKVQTRMSQYQYCIGVLVWYWWVLVLVLVRIGFGIGGHWSWYWWVLVLALVAIGIGIGISITLKKSYLEKLLIFHKV